jgi:YidC/Oxa1 family membrane protein insertase
MKTQTQNTILALVLSFLVITAWTILFPPVQPEVDATAPLAGETATSGGLVTPPAAGIDTATTAGTATSPGADRTSALAESPRIEIDTPDLEGSITLLGGRIDDLRLKGYRESIDADAAIVSLFTPAGEDHAYYALYGWAPGGALELGDVPGATTPWQIESGDRLTPTTPITLAWTNAQSMTFRRTIAVDEQYMFTITQSVENGSGATQRLAPYGVIARHGMPDDLRGFFILHEGVVRQTDQELAEISYKDVGKFDLDPREGAAAETKQVTENGWIGFTDHYWMTVLAPEPGQPFTSVAKHAAAADIYQTEIRLPTVEVAAGASASTTTRLFAGAKEWDTIRDYEKSEGIYRFLDSIDWGMFFFITKPMFAVLHWLNVLIGNMGWAIIGLTFVIKLVLFPLSYKSYVSMARMRELQPEMEKIKERVGDDKQAQQKEMMELYKREKVNPASGCLPILLQIPIWFSLYKVIFVTLELRHAPWIGWIRDLSAPDPSSIFNLFGLLPYAAPGPESLVAFFSLGILPILLGVSMWLQQKLNPAPTDPTQAMIMGWLPWVFMFMLGTFASGLVLYWIANNVLTFTQQYTIMRSHGHKPDLFGNIRSGFKRKPKDDKK